MPRLHALDAGAATGKAQALLGGVRDKLGLVPNMMRTMESSPAVLQGYLGLSGALATGTLPATLREQIALAVAQANGCHYCLAAQRCCRRHRRGLSEGAGPRARGGMTRPAHAVALVPPFTRDTALAKVQAAEDAWNSRDPDRVARAYSEDSAWRVRAEFFRGRDAIRAFLQRKWQHELDYRLVKELRAFAGNHISVRFETEWHDAAGQWFRTHGNEHWEFDADGLMRRRDMSANDIPIAEHERRLR